jgi:hypothetical protein
MERLFDKKILAIQTDWEGSTRNLHLSFNVQALLIMSLVHTRIGKMDQQSTSIAI